MKVLTIVLLLFMLFELDGIKRILKDQNTMMQQQSRNQITTQ